MSVQRRLVMTVLASLIAAGGPAFASGGEKKKSGKPEVAEGLEVLNVPLPIQRNGKLINYLYLSTKLLPAPHSDIWKMRESTHFLREGIVMAAHRTDFSDPANPEKLDTKRATAMIAAEAAKIYGQRAIAKVEITSVDSQRTGIAKRYARAVVAEAKPY